MSQNLGRSVPTCSACGTQGNGPRAGPVPVLVGWLLVDAGDAGAGDPSVGSPYDGFIGGGGGSS